VARTLLLGRLRSAGRVEIKSVVNELFTAIVFKKIIYHFPFVILDLSLEEKTRDPIFPMTYLKLQIENDK
jgi:hypothetical protein